MNNLIDMFFEDSSSDDDDDLDMFTLLLVDYARKKKRKHRGSIVGREVVRRPQESGHDKLFRDYFCENPIYGHRFFRRRFRMSRHLFIRIANAVKEHCPYFVQKRNAAGKLGHSCFKKVAASIRMLASGCAADLVDDWLYIGESTAIKSMRLFVKSVVEIFGDRYLRAPNEEDTARLMQYSESIGFRGMLGSIDCMHWPWERCPTALHGQFTGHCHDPTIILEAVASHDLWIWHAYFGMPGSCNDINVLHRSPLFAWLATGEAPPVNFEVNDH
jgi:hypothetical protein